MKITTLHNATLTGLIALWATAFAPQTLAQTKDVKLDRTTLPIAKPD